MSCPLCGDVCRCNPDLCSNGLSGDQNSLDACPASAGFSLPLQNRGAAALREELAARVHRYRSRRTYRGPRYPSLRLKFEPAEGNTSHHVGSTSLAPSSDAAVRPSFMAENAATQPRAARYGPDVPPRALGSPNAVQGRESVARDAVAKIIEFPRSGLAPVPLDELAERVADRPRILDVPEPAPPPPALGGILIGPVAAAEPEARPGLDVPLQSAALDQRLLASAIDVCLVLVASAVFGYLWFRITDLSPAPRFAAGAMAAVSGFFWVLYQYLFIVYTSTTPGLKSARLQLIRFDGALPGRSLRRWRVLVSLLSAVSLGMGFFWCLLDEDALCWHDRMTRTYLAPKVGAQAKI